MNKANETTKFILNIRLWQLAHAKFSPQWHMLTTTRFRNR